VAYTDIYTAATDSSGTLRKKVAVAIHKAAVDVLAEATNTPNYNNRRAWAIKATTELSSPMNESERWIWKVLENTTIQASPGTATDGDVQFVINSIVDVMANRG
jgi:hypothetical protein